MFNLQVTLSDLRSRKRQFVPLDPLIVVLRFGPIKLDIKLNPNGQQLLGGKRIILDLNPDQLKNMFSNFALAMFISNQQGNFFTILSLEKLQLTDIVSGQEIYFFNDNQEIVYTANLSLLFNDFKNPRMPNPQKIENHKTFIQFFKKPAVPSSSVPAKTLSSFLYGNKAQKSGKQKMSTTGKLSTQKPSSAQPKNKKIKITTQTMTKKKEIPEFLATHQPQFQIYKPFDTAQDIDDDNPPVMQFTNTVTDPSKGIGLLKTQMAQLNLTAPQSIKFMAAYDSKNQFSKTKGKESRNTIIKIQEKLKSNQNLGSKTTNSFKENTGQVKVNRDELRNKAKKQMQTYQGGTSIKIPVLKDGKYELIELALLNEQEIVNFAKKQRQIELEEEKKRAVEKQLQKRQKENINLKKQLEEKQKLLAKQQKQAKKQKLQLLQAKQLADKNKKLALTSKASEPKKNSSNSQFEDSEEQKYEQQENPQKDSDEEHNEEDEDNYYESDFESASMASAQKKSRISEKKQDESLSYNEYNQSYDPDFQSYSQSLLGSQPRLSMSEISESLRSVSPKRK